MAGIKETLELISSVSAAIDSIDKILADGQVDFRDITSLPQLIADLRPGLQGVANVKAEIQDMDKEELVLVLNECVDLVAKIMAKFGA